jgi:hypothetical protein
MKNNYTIQNDGTVEIELLKGKHKTIISAEDFGIANSIPGTWSLIKNKQKKVISYVVCSSHATGKAKLLFLHRLILGITDGNLRGDHINHNTLDNTRGNLRIASQLLNNANKADCGNNSNSGYMGVHKLKHRNLFAAHVRCNGHKIHLGYFKNPEEAHDVYLNAKSVIMRRLESTS